MGVRFEINFFLIEVYVIEKNLTSRRKNSLLLKAEKSENFVRDMHYIFHKNISVYGFGEGVRFQLFLLLIVFGF